MLGPTEFVVPPSTSVAPGSKVTMTVSVEQSSAITAVSVVITGNGIVIPNVRQNIVLQSETMAKFEVDFNVPESLSQIEYGAAVLFSNDEQSDVLLSESKFSVLGSNYSR